MDQDDPVARAFASAPLDTRPAEELDAEAAVNASCDPSGPWVPHGVVSALLALRIAEAPDESAAE